MYCCCCFHVSCLVLHIPFVRLPWCFVFDLWFKVTVTNALLSILLLWLLLLFLSLTYYCCCYLCWWANNAWIVIQWHTNWHMCLKANRHTHLLGYALYCFLFSKEQSIYVYTHPCYCCCYGCCDFMLIHTYTTSITLFLMSFFFVFFFFFFFLNKWIKTSCYCCKNWHNYAVQLANNGQIDLFRTPTTTSNVIKYNNNKLNNKNNRL